MLHPGEPGCSRSVRSSLEVVWEENSRPLSVEGLTTAEAASELAEEMGVGTSIKGMPPVRLEDKVVPLEAGSSEPGVPLVIWRGGRGDLFCFFHLDESLMPPALIFSWKYHTSLALVFKLKLSLEISLLLVLLVPKKNNLYPILVPEEESRPLEPIPTPLTWLLHWPLYRSGQPHSLHEESDSLLLGWSLTGPALAHYHSAT